MYFFKNKPSELSSKEIAKNIKISSVKRSTSLDLKSSWIHITEENKSFLSYENNNQIDLLRISSPFEKFLPKLIVSFKKDNYKEYKLRLKLTSIMVLFILLVTLALNIFSSIKEGELQGSFLQVLIFNIIFYVLLLIEYKLLNKKIGMLINK